MSEKRRFFTAVIAIIVAVIAVSCSEQKFDPSSEFAGQSFEAWIKKYDPAAVPRPSGIYIRFVERDPNFANLPAPVIGNDWLTVNYTARRFDNTVVETRNSELSRLIGLWVATTHFVPDFVPFGVSQKLSAGVIDALSYMRKGDSARIYIPTSLAYVSSMSVNTGYSPAGVNYMNYPLYFDIRLAGIVSDPYQWELQMLKQYAIERGFDPLTDSVEKGLYVKIIKKNPLGDTITKDSTVNIWFDNYFFDGQLVTTNVDSIARQAGYYSSAVKYVKKELAPAQFAATTGSYLVYAKAVLKMRKGETAEALAVSWLGPGMSGDLAAKPQLLPYHSTRYMIRVVADTTKK